MGYVRMNRSIAIVIHSSGMDEPSAALTVSTICFLLDIGNRRRMYRAPIEIEYVGSPFAVRIASVNGKIWSVCL